MKSKGRANRWPTGLCPPAGEASPAGDRDWVPELEPLASPFVGLQMAIFGGAAGLFWGSGGSVLGTSRPVRVGTSVGGATVAAYPPGSDDPEIDSFTLFFASSPIFEYTQCRICL